MKAGNCKHFTGIMKKSCAAGVPYDAIKDTSVGVPLAMGRAVARAVRVAVGLEAYK